MITVSFLGTVLASTANESDMYRELASGLWFALSICQSL